MKALWLSALLILVAGTKLALAFSPKPVILHVIAGSCLEQPLLLTLSPLPKGTPTFALQVPPGKEIRWKKSVGSRYFLLTIRDVGNKKLLLKCGRPYDLRVGKRILLRRGQKSFIL